MAYTIQVLTPPASEPVTATDLIAQLRINDDAESALLSAYITSARMIFEAYTQRAVYPTTFRQYHDYWLPQTQRSQYGYGYPFGYGSNYGYDSWQSGKPHLTLMRGPVTAINSVHYYDTTDTLQAFTDFNADIIDNPSKLYLNSCPALSVNVHPKLYIEYVAGWTSDNIPQPVVQAIQLLAAHFFEHRTNTTEMNLKELPMGFTALCSLYQMGLVPSDWRA